MLVKYLSEGYFPIAGATVSISTRGKSNKEKHLGTLFNFGF